MNTRLPGVLLAATVLTVSLGACTKLDQSATNSAATPANSAAASAPAAKSSASLNSPPVAHVGENSVLRAAPASRAYVDPVTGELRDPTADEILVESRVRASAAVTVGSTGKAIKSAQTVEVALPGGLTEVRLGNRMRVDEKVCVQRDGSISDHCPTMPKSTTQPSK